MMRISAAGIVSGLLTFAEESNKSSDVHKTLPQRPKNRVVNFKLDDAGWDALEVLQLIQSNRANRVISRSQVLRELIKKAAK